MDATYVVKIVVYSTSNALYDEEDISFSIPSPAHIINVHHNPDVVFADDTVTVYAQLLSSDSSVTLHYQPVGGSESTASMTYSLAQGEFVATIPAHPADTTVNYWVTATNGAFFDISPIISPDSGSRKLNFLSLQNFLKNS